MKMVAAWRKQSRGRGHAQNWIASFLFLGVSYFCVPQTVHDNKHNWVSLWRKHFSEWIGRNLLKMNNSTDSEGNHNNPVVKKEEVAWDKRPEAPVHPTPAQQCPSCHPTEDLPALPPEHFANRGLGANPGQTLPNCTESTALLSPAVHMAPFCSQSRRNWLPSLLV